jgi:hypothetical protein
MARSMLNMNIDPWLKMALVGQAKLHNRSMSNLVETVLSEWVRCQHGGTRPVPATQLPTADECRAIFAHQAR